MRRYVARRGHAAATKPFLCATPIEADEMLRIGFLTDLVPADALGDTVTRYLQALADNEANTMTAMTCSLAELAAGTADAATLERRHLASLSSPALRERLDRLLDA
jgi:enoyl-CoA hydratase/carnithine racemase